MAITSLIHEFPTARKAIAITFDDGPDPEITSDILEIFRQASAEARATFFMIGEQMERNPEAALAVHTEGHEIGNHTWSHPNLTELGEQEARLELERTEGLIIQVTGKKPAVLRPPYLAMNEAVEELGARMNYRTIGTVNGDARDWDMPGTEHILTATRAAVKPGGILLFHDGLGDRSQTVEAIRTLVPELIGQGYELVTVSELMRS